MTVLEGILLGVLQGLTEFLPVSSSGHLALAEHLLNARTPGVAFEVALHFATALAVLLFFRRRVAAVLGAMAAWVRQRVGLGRSGGGAPAEGAPGRPGLKGGRNEDARLGFHLMLGTVPAGVVGYLFEDAVARAFGDPRLVSALLIATGLILWTTRYARGERRRHETWRDALAVGCAQAVAVLPGISRSGATIAAGIACGLERKKAAEFAFLLSVPIILGASFVSLGDAAAGGASLGIAGVAGVVAAFCVALPSIAVLMKVVTAGGLHRFAYYCWAVGALGLVLTAVL